MQQVDNPGMVPSHPDRTVVGLVGFARALRHAGMTCGPRRIQAFLTAAAEIDIAERSQLYWAGRLTLCADPDDLPRFDAAFERWFGDTAVLFAQQHHPHFVRQSRGMALAEGDGEGERGEVAEIAAAASDVEMLRHRDFSELSASERDYLRKMFGQLVVQPPQRPALRHRPFRRGELDPHATMRAMLRTGGEPLTLPRRRRARRARRVVLLIDVSGSMAPYADSLLRFAHLVMRRAPASTEVFTLGTRMTRVSRQLRQRDPEHALAAAARAVPDYSGGTRLGETLQSFLDRWGQRGVARRAVVVLFSDGWERGSTDLLAEQMRRLRRLAHAVVWSNPHAGHAGYEPVQSGIAAALPHVDRLVAGHSLRSLQQLWDWVRYLASADRVAWREVAGARRT